jgi:gliding motility-associated-like protein
MTVSVGSPVTPTFNAIAPVCEGGSITLPGSSIEGFTGTWSPAIDNTQTTAYTFTPTAGQCANNGSLTVTVTPLVDPTFNQVGPICSGSALSLPASSIENITGTWSPAPNNTATTPYTFVPDAGQCSNNGAMTVVVNSATTPTFTQIAPICSGGTINLPTSSLEGISGTWSPAVNNTATTTYTFTPSAGQCATTATMTVNVGGPVTPTFDPWGPFCQNDIIIQVILPETSNEGITGTWNPAMVSTAVAGNIVHTFTPDAGQCATSTTMTVVVNPQVTTTFAQIAPICVGDPLSLPGTSLEGIPGSWSPAVNNVTTTTYNFVPNAGQCATEATMTVNVGPPATPTFDQVGPVCNGQAFTLPPTSLEGFTGTWSPAINTTTTTNYTFVPTAGQCAVDGAMTVTVTSPITPTFTSVGPVCSGDGILLPPSSLEGITGTWSPAVNNTATTNYTFTPTAGQCANNAAMTVAVNPNPTIDLAGLTVVNEHCGQADGSISGIVANGGTPGYSFEWNNSATMTTVDISGLASGTYVLEVMDTEGCIATANVNVGADVAPVIDGTAVQSVDPTCSTGGSISGLSVNAGSTYAVSWTGSTGTSLDLNNLAAGSYTVTVTDSYGCQDSFGPITLTAPAGVTASFTWSPNEPNEGDVVAFTNTSSGAGPIISTWTIAGSDTVATNISEVFDVEGTYDVMLSIVDANGCVDTIVQTVSVFGSLVVPNVITSNGDNVNDTFEIKGLKPNTQVTIIDRWGIVVFESDNYNNDWGGKDRSGADLTDGVYTYIYTTADGKSGHGFVHLIRD